MQQQQHHGGVSHETPLPLTNETSTMPCNEIDLGQHHLIMLDDQSIELMHRPYALGGYVLHLESGEAYRLMRCLQEMFNEARGEQS